jgi:Flp pilus assembly protein TadG
MHRSAHTRNERGSATVFVIGFAIVLLACAGLVIDGGGALNARMTLSDDVEQAARAGAQEVDVDYLRQNGVVRLNPGAAETAARSYLVSKGYTVGQVSATDDTVRVSAKDTVNTKLLMLIGVNSFDVNATATAEAVTQ